MAEARGWMLSMPHRSNHQHVNQGYSCPNQQRRHGNQTRHERSRATVFQILNLLFCLEQ